MIKVRVVRTGLPIATGLIALSSGLAACTTEQATEDIDESDSAYTVANPGSGVFELGFSYGTSNGFAFNLTKSTTDEYVRAKEQMSFALPAYFLWQRLYPNDALPNDVARLKKLSAKVKITYFKQGASYGQTSVTSNAWQGDQSWNLQATTGSFIVSRRARAMRFEIVITDAQNPNVSTTVAQDQFLEVPVFGGTLPQKTLLFDTMGTTMRSRVIEGGLPVRGAELAIGYSDWRAATLVDTSSLDRTIGTQTSYSRFGAIEVPMYGELEHEIAFGVGIDGVWQAEKALGANAKSPLMPPAGRVAYEGRVSVPGSAQNLQFYFHVKTFLKVDYSRFSNIRWRKYQDGARILVREKWDNENGVSGDNWDIATEQ
jgi:hypothetical protein